MTEREFLKREPFGRIAELPITPRTYYELIRHVNDLLQAELRAKFAEHAGTLGNGIVVATTGSDVRREKGSLMSPVEFLALVGEDVNPQSFSQTLAGVINSVVSNDTNRPRVIEVKTPHSPLYFFKDTNIIQPARVGDLRVDEDPFFGSVSDVRRAKMRLGTELVSAPRSVIDKIAGLPRDARKVVESGKNRIGGEDRIHFDLEGEAVFYDPESRQLSFKIGPLRFVQNTLLFETVRHMRREGDPGLLSTLPSGIVHRLEQLSDDRMVNRTRETINLLAEHYLFFLKLYHISEQKYQQSEQTVLSFQDLGITEDDVARRLADLQQILQNFQIQSPEAKKIPAQ